MQHVSLPSSLYLLHLLSYSSAILLAWPSLKLYIHNELLSLITGMTLKSEQYNYMLSYVVLNFCMCMWNRCHPSGWWSLQVAPLLLGPRWCWTVVPEDIPSLSSHGWKLQVSYRERKLYVTYLSSLHSFVDSLTQYTVHLSPISMFVIFKSTTYTQHFIQGVFYCKCAVFFWN